LLAAYPDPATLLQRMLNHHPELVAANDSASDNHERPVEDEIVSA
jgi:hypothetical protein